MISGSKEFDEVGQFNALPRPRVTPGGVPNDWHFDLRYIQFEPPSHILFMIQPESQFVQMEQLPLQGKEQSLKFFPDTAAEASSEVAKAIIHSFVDNMGQNKMMGPTAPPSFAPWRLMTECRSLATEVGKELRHMGVHRDLCKIDTSVKLVIELAQEAFERLFGALKVSMGFEVLSGVIAPPTGIVFRPLQLPANSDDQAEKMLDYAKALESAEPPIDGGEKDYKALITHVGTLLASKSLNMIKQEAEEGHPEAMVDYALRLRYGIGCESNRSLSRAYLVQALYSPSSPDGLKATAHALLIDWCLTGFKEALPTRYMFAACHHANEAIVLGRAAAATVRKPKPGTSFAAPMVLAFLFTTFRHFGTYEKFLWYKHAAAEMDLLKAEIENEASAMNDKRMKHPNRHRCATVGCGIESNTGKVLQCCGGKCDPDVKPFYCSKECQRADWKNHKPFCKPGAPCSVIDPEYSTTSAATGSAGSIQIPVKGLDGKTTVMGSSIINEKMLKEMRDFIEASGGFPKTG